MPGQRRHGVHLHPPGGGRAVGPVSTQLPALMWPGAACRPWRAMRRAGFGHHQWWWLGGGCVWGTAVQPSPQARSPTQRRPLAWLFPGPPPPTPFFHQAGLPCPALPCPALQVRRLQPPAEPRAALPPLLRPPHAQVRAASGEEAARKQRLVLHMPHPEGRHPQRSDHAPLVVAHSFARAPDPLRPGPPSPAA